MKKLFLPIAILILFFAGCSNLAEDISSSDVVNVQNNSEKILIKGSVGFSGSIPSEIQSELKNENVNNSSSKSAIPSISGGAEWYVKATKSGTAQVVTGTITSIAGSNNKIFELGLSTGTWIIEAGIKNASGTILLTDSVTKTLTLNDSVVNIDFTLKPLSSGTGSVNLSMNINDIADTFVLIIANTNQQSKWETGTLEFQGSLASIYSIVGSDIPCGIYDITFNFYKNSILVYSTTQLINVFANMTTDKWVSGSSGTGGIIEGNIFTLTSSLTAAFARSTFYVSSTGDDDTGTGGPYSPLKTLSKAMSFANANTETGTKNIYIKAGGSEVLSSQIAFSKDTNVEVYTTKPGDKTGRYTVTRGTTGGITTSSMVTVGSGVTVLISGLKIDGNQHEVSVQGAGINNAGILTLENTEIRYCYSTWTNSRGGGGIFSNSTLNLYGATKIHHNKAPGGGGICFNTDSATKMLTIGKDSSDNNVEIYSNTATSIGSGVMLFNAAKAVMNAGKIYENNTDGSGTIYSWGNNTNATSFIMNGGSIYNNTADKGGAVYIDDSSGNKASFIMTGGTIYGNTANTGSAVCHSAGSSDNSQLQLSGAAYIAGGNDIYLGIGKVVTIADALSPTSDGTAGGTEQTYTAKISLESGFVNGASILKASSADLITNNMNKFVMSDGSYGITQKAVTDTTAILVRSYYVAGAGHSVVTTDGSDDADGTEFAPLATVSKAASLCGVGSIIYVDGTTTETTKILINENITIKALSSNATLIRGAGNTGAMIAVSQQKSLTLEGITINGNDVTVSVGTAGISNDGTLTLINSVITKCIASNSGGAIYSSTDTNVYLYGNTTLSYNTAEYGGAICIGEESYNSAILVIGKDKNTDSVRINNNVAINQGGAIIAKGGARITMNSGSIFDNTAGTESNTNSRGGALYLWGDSSYTSRFTMNGGSIHGNKAVSSNNTGYGGAVCIDDGNGNSSSFTMNGGEIYSNTAYLGKAIYHAAGDDDNGQLNVSGDALIKYDNDIYLGANKLVTIAGNLTLGTAASPSAYVTLETPSIGSTVVKASTAQLIEDNISKIKINNACWELTQGTENDAAKKNGILKHKIYVAEDGNNNSGTGSQEKPYATLKKAIDTAINGTIIYISGTINETQAVTIGKNVQIEKYGTSAVIQRTQYSTTLLTIKLNSTVTIKDITIDGNGNNFEISANGGGIYNNGTLTLEGCTIKNCKTSGNGGGIYNSATLNLIDTVIKDCAVTDGTSAGNGIYNDGTLNIQGSTYLAEDNDIYLGANKLVTIAGTLTPTDTGDASGTAQTYTATITPAAYSVDTEVLAEALSGLLDSNYYRFKLTSIDYCINNSGKIVSNIQTKEGLLTALSNASDGDVLYVGYQLSLNGSTELKAPANTTVTITRSNTCTGVMFSNSGGTTVIGDSNDSTSKLIFDGGGIESAGPMFDIRFQIDFYNCEIKNAKNVSSINSSGGAVAVGSYNSAHFVNCYIHDCEAKNGGAIYGDDIFIHNTKIENCVATENNGGNAICTRNDAGRNLYITDYADITQKTTISSAAAGCSIYCNNTINITDTANVDKIKFGYIRNCKKYTSVNYDSSVSDATAFTYNNTETISDGNYKLENGAFTSL